MSCSKPSPYFFLPVILVQVDLNFSCPKSAFPEVVLDVFWQSLIRPCLQLVVNPLYLLSWSLLLIVDFGSDTSTSWRVFFSWLDIVKGFFFTMERILRSSTTVVLCGRPGPFMLLSSLVLSFFSEYTKQLIWPLLMFLLSLWWICFVLKPNNSVSLVWRDPLILLCVCVCVYIYIYIYIYIYCPPKVWKHPRKVGFWTILAWILFNLW